MSGRVTTQSDHSKPVRRLVPNRNVHFRPFQGLKVLPYGPRRPEGSYQVSEDLIVDIFWSGLVLLLLFPTKCKCKPKYSVYLPDGDYGDDGRGRI